MVTGVKFTSLVISYRNKIYSKTELTIPMLIGFVPFIFTFLELNLFLENNNVNRDLL